MKKNLRFSVALGMGLVLGGLGFSQHSKADAFDDMLGQNTPPNGSRSLFDHLMVKKDASGKYSYQLPAKFEDLVSEISRLGGNTEPSVVMFPKGRSLQRKKSSYQDPRVVVAFDKMPALTSETKVFLKDRIYLGFVAKEHQIEVVSYNEDAGRFEYQLVTDYEAPGKKPVVTYAEREFCMSCHQSAGTIFSRQPWMETNGFENEHGQSPVRTELTNIHGQTYRGFPLNVAIDTPYNFDNSTDRANNFLAWQRLWVEGCGAENSPEANMCRARIFLVSVQGLVGADYGLIQSEDDKLYDFWTGSGNTKELALLLPDIANRSPFDNAIGQQAGGADTGMSGGQAESALSQFRERARADENNRLNQLLLQSDFPAALDPLVPRKNFKFNPDTGTFPKYNEEFTLYYLVEGIQENYFSDQERAKLKGKAFRDIKKFILEMGADPAGPFGPQTFKRRKILGGLFAKLGIQNNPMCCEAHSGMPLNVESGEIIPPSVGSKDPIALFHTYCNTCHKAGREKRLEFFTNPFQVRQPNGPIPDEWLRLIRKGKKPCKRLNWEKIDPSLINVEGESTMPPQGGNRRESRYYNLKQNPDHRKSLLKHYRFMAGEVLGDSSALSRLKRILAEERAELGDLAGIPRSEMPPTFEALVNELKNDVVGNRSGLCVIQ